MIKFNVSREAALKCVAMLQFFQWQHNKQALAMAIVYKIKCPTSTFNLSLFIIALSRLRKCTKKLMLPFARTPCMKRSLPKKSRRRGKKRLARLTATMSHPLEQIEQIKKQRETLLIKFVVDPQVEPCQAVSGSEERPRRPEEGQLPSGTGTGGFRIKCWSASQKNCSINLLKKPHALVFFPFFLNWRHYSLCP